MSASSRVTPHVRARQRWSARGPFRTLHSPAVVKPQFGRRLFDEHRQSVTDADKRRAFAVSAGKLCRGIKHATHQPTTTNPPTQRKYRRGGSRRPLPRPIHRKPRPATAKAPATKTPPRSKTACAYDHVVDQPKQPTAHGTEERRKQQGMSHPIVNVKKPLNNPTATGSTIAA